MQSTSSPAPSAPAAQATQGIQNTPSAAKTTGSFPWLNITLPPGWRETTPGHYEGQDGFAWLEIRDRQGAGMGAICMSEANKGKPDHYGAFPEIRDTVLAEQPACLIMPSADQPAGRKTEALYLLWLPEQIRADGLLALHADRAHIENIVQSLGFAEPVVLETVNPCDFSIAGSPAETTSQGGLRVGAFPIARGPGCSPYKEAAAFSQQVENGVAGLRAKQVKDRQWSQERLDRLNKKLKPFGYMVGAYGENLYRVLRAGKVARSNLSWVGQVTVRSDGQNFIFPVLDGYNATAYLVRPDGVHALDDPDLLVYDQVFPVFSGADRIELAYEYQRYPRPPSSPALLEIRKNGTLIDTLSVSGATPAKGPVRGLWSWQDAQGASHWTLMLDGLVIEDGQNLNERLNVPEILTWRLLKEKPFYLYQTDGQVRAMYNGQEIPGAYDTVIAEPQWSDRILIQMRIYESGLVYFAKKSGVWYLVVVEAE